MTFETFQRSVHRAAEEDLEVVLTGQGEPLIHPDFDAFVSYLPGRARHWNMTSNASLMTEAKAQHILDSGIRRITFSVSDLGEDYEEVYNLSFDEVRHNIFRFMELNDQKGHPCEIWISIVQHDINEQKLDSIVQFWKDAKVDNFFTYRQITRGGACDLGNHFIGNDTYLEEARDLLSKEEVSTLCSLAFTAPFVGWNGKYYICCSDYEKKTPLGSVFDYSLDALDQVKLKSIADGNSACLLCNYDPVNLIRETLFEIEQGESKQSVLKNRIAVLKQGQEENPELYSELDWERWIDSVQE